MTKYGSIRRFDGKIYRYITSRETKKEAQLAAKGSRMAGKKARIVKRKDKWEIYTRD